MRLSLILAIYAMIYLCYGLCHFFLTTPEKRLAYGYAMTRRWAKAICLVSGYKVSISGPIPTGACLLAPNHLGYVDIPPIASVCPAFFLAKADVRQWPVLGFAGATVFAIRFVIMRRLVIVLAVPIVIQCP